MFGPPGHLYCYRSYGLHTCANVVTEASGRCAAVLLRAVEPLEGVEAMVENRRGRRGWELTNGPGKVCEALGIGLEHYGQSVVRGPIGFFATAGQERPRVGVSERIGISKGKEHPWRFFDVDSPWVGAPRRPRRVLRRR